MKLIQNITAELEQLRRSIHEKLELAAPDDRPIGEIARELLKNREAASPADAVAKARAAEEIRVTAVLELEAAEQIEGELLAKLAVALEELRAERNQTAERELAKARSAYEKAVSKIFGDNSPVNGLFSMSTHFASVVPFFEQLAAVPMIRPEDETNFSTWSDFQVTAPAPNRINLAAMGYLPGRPELSRPEWITDVDMLLESLKKL